MSTVGGFQRRSGKNGTTRRILKKYDPKVMENPKKALFMKGTSASDVVNDAMNDLYAMMQPYCKKLKKKNAFLPFEGREHLEFLGFKNDCSLFCFGSHNKKRPHNITLGRQFDFHLLDMIEMGILAADPLDMGRAVGLEVGSVASKPFFVFEGTEFETDPTFQRLKNFLVDFFRGSNDPEINLDGCDRVIFFSLRSENGQDACVPPSTDCHTGRAPTQRGNTVLCMRHYAVQKPSCSTGVPKTIKNIKLFDIGPNFDFQLRRISFATPQEFKLACKLPKQALATLRSTQENVSSDSMDNLRGQLHVGKQDITELNLRRFKAHRGGTRHGSRGENGGEGGDDAMVYAGVDEHGESLGEGPRKRRRRGASSAGGEAETRPETDI